MPKFAPKAIFALFSLNKAGKKPLGRDRLVIIFSTAVTVGLVALYIFGKATSRW